MRNAFVNLKNITVDIASGCFILLKPSNETDLNMITQRFDLRCIQYIQI